MTPKSHKKYSLYILSVRFGRPQQSFLFFNGFDHFFSGFDDVPHGFDDLVMGLTMSLWGCMMSLWV